MAKCTFGKGNSIKPDGVHELDPCVYEVVEEYRNVTVRVLRCINCGYTETEWEPQENTERIGDEDG